MPTRGAGSGFTLVELSIVLVVMGIIAFLVYGPVFDLVRKERVRDGAALLEKVAEKLSGQAAGTGRLPDPEGGLLPAGFAATDPWGQPVRYWLAPELAGGARLTGVPGSSLAVRTYRTVGSGGAFPAADAELVSEAGNLAFVLASTGPDLRQQMTVTSAGGQTVINVLKGGGSMQDGSGADYDDLMIFFPLGQFKALLIQ
ncbi:MAG: prepilin-type N-terminal cleavage/methylation domain-containing protein [Thermodesulfobacteriota bacterium]